MRYRLTSLLALSAIVLFVAPAYAGPNWSHHSKPFDLVWDRNHEDLNGLPMNPQWGYQLDHPGKLPNFQALCGGAFYNAQGMTASSTSGSGNNAVNNAKLASTCTSQHTNLDVSTSSLVGDWSLASLAGNSSAYCTSGAGGFNGHLTWAVATYTGFVTWSDWSGNPSFFGNFDLADGDYNLALFPSEYAPKYQAGFTTLNNSNNGEHGIGLEFNDGETVDNAGSAWWQQLVNSVENGAQPSPGVLLAQTLGFIPNVTTSSAVVTGVVGIDGVHGDYTELHPVYALALQQSISASKGKILETWDYFLRNSGSGGGCSSQTLYWQPPQNDNNRDARYFMSLPWPAGATSVKVLQNSGFSWQGQQPVADSWVGASGKKGWTEIDAVFSDHAQNNVGGLDGQVTLRYTMPTTADHKKAAWQASGTESQTPPFREDAFKIADLASLIPDAAARTKFSTDAAQSLSPYTVQPKVKPVAFMTLGAQPHAYRTAASSGTLTPPAFALDTLKQHRDSAVKKLLTTYRPHIKPPGN